jgi:hypothetical protein
MQVGRIIVAISLIFFGALSLLKRFDLFPIQWCTAYQQLAVEYWPVLLILGGVKLLVKKRAPALAAFLGLVIVLLGVLWVVCRLGEHSGWMKV